MLYPMQSSLVFLHCLLLISFSPDCPLSVSTATEENLVTDQLAHLHRYSIPAIIPWHLSGSNGEMVKWWNVRETHCSSSCNAQLHLFRGDLCVANLQRQFWQDFSIWKNLQRCSQENLDSHPLLENTGPGVCNTSFKLLLTIVNHCWTLLTIVHHCWPLLTIVDQTDHNADHDKSCWRSSNLAINVLVTMIPLMLIIDW